MLDEELSMILHAEGVEDLVIETNINLEPKSAELYADIWLLPEKNQSYKANKCLHQFKGEDAVSDAVKQLGEILNDPLAGRRLVKGGGK